MYQYKNHLKEISHQRVGQRQVYQFDWMELVRCSWVWHQDCLDVQKMYVQVKVEVEVEIEM